MSKQYKNLTLMLYSEAKAAKQQVANILRLPGRRFHLPGRAQPVLFPRRYSRGKHSFSLSFNYTLDPEHHCSK